ncbi:centrosome-associated protein ALMS1-like [Nelusetta ayraudi]
MELDRGQRSSSQGSVGTAPPPRRHQDPERDGGSEGGGPLDQLWLKFCSQWRREESRLSAERDGSLLERLERLSRLIGRGDEWRREGGGQDASAGRPAGRLPASGQDRTRPLPPQEAAPPAGVAPADSVSVASGSVSSVDTTRLARVFGAERVRRLRTSTSTSASIHKLHRTIQEQKEGKNKEEAADSFSQSEASDQVAADSESSTSTFTVLSHRRTPAARKPVGLVSRGVQAGGLQLDWSSRTGLHTRDQGLGHAPSPSCSSSAASERGGGGGGGGGRSPARTSQRRRRIFPKSISWFVSAEELRSEARKENRPAGGRSSAWFQPYSSAAPWREPLRQRQVPEDRSSHRHHHRPGGKATPPAGAPVSLQEALRRNRPEFIHQSRQRVERLALRSEDRRLQELYREVHEVYSMEPPRRPAGAVLLRRAVPRTEMIQRSKQIYESLPEVQRRRADQRRKAEYELYRLNARLYNKKITSRVVNRRTAWN